MQKPALKGKRKGIEASFLKVSFPDAGEPSSRIGGQYAGRTFVVRREYNPDNNKTYYFIGANRITERNPEWRFIKDHGIPAGYRYK